MKLIQKLTLLLSFTVLLGGIALYGGSNDTAYAAECKSGEIKKDNKCVTGCGGVQTSIIVCDNKEKSKKLEDNGAWQILIIVLNIMAGGVAIAAIAGFVYGGILYATAEDKADRVSKAKQTIFNVVLGLILFAFMFSLLQFLIPGGIFR